MYHRSVPPAVIAVSHRQLTLALRYVNVASLAGISLALVYLPGHPPYYQIAALILAKTYSNSMIAALNSRVKVVANRHAAALPAWNEAGKLDHLTWRGAGGIEFICEEATVSSSAYTT